MPALRRFVYSPKVFAYVNTGTNDKPSIQDLTGFITSGSVSRRLNQVSSAELTIRNPDQKWTKPGEPTFRPMDPITIYMIRRKNRPVQVFTGYLDRTPYLQLYPGTVTLTASCTLKRLLHTYFDPALPYMFEFLAQYGWLPNSKTGGISNPSIEFKSAGTAPLANSFVRDGVQIEDSGFGKLLYATVNQIGQWKQNEIYIEKLPSEVPQKVARIFTAFRDDNKAALADFQTLLGKFIGIGAEGGGAPGGDATSGTLGPGTNSRKTYCYFVSAGFSEQMAAAITGNFQAESGINPNSVEVGNTGNGRGIAQWDVRNRWLTLQKFAESKGKDYRELGTQLDFVIQEINDSYRGVLDFKTSTESPSVLAIKFGKIYEGYGIEGNRRAEAEKAYEAHAGKCGPTESATSSAPAGTSRTEIATTTSQFRAANEGGLQADTTSNAESDVETTRRDLPRNDKRGSGNGGFVEGASSERLQPNVLDFAEQLFALGYNCSSAFRASSDTFHGKGQAVDWGDASNNIENLTKVLFPLRFQLDELWIPSGPNQGFYNLGVKGGTDRPDHIHVAVTRKIDLGVVGVPGGGGAEDGGAASGDTVSRGNAAAFAAQLNFPSIAESSESILLQGQKSLMNDKPLFPFVEQLCGASLRLFQSLPNGTFFAFYPDYFGEFDKTTGGRDTYWTIDDVEILDGSIELTDDTLVTHEYVVGDTLFNGIGIVEKLQSSGVVSVFNAFSAGPDNEALVPEFDGKQGREAALAFLQKYGARPELHEAPMIRSPYYEAFLAYQRFLLAWSRQFATNFTFTFMPELYPGGRVGFETHGIQCFIEEVTHSFDYTSGFTTSATLSAPSVFGKGGRVGKGLIRDGFDKKK